MAKVYDNWERLVTSTLRREQLRISGQRTPSDLSLASASSSSFNFNASSRRLSPFKFPSSLKGVTFDYDQILRSTAYFSNSNLIRQGRSGDFFRGILEDGTQVVVKKIDLFSADKELYCMSELEVFGKFSHTRLVPLLGHCLESWDEKYLVYKYMPNRDISSSLYRDIVSDDDNRLPSLDWITRLKIATGAAEALVYLHHECNPPLVHRDVQASSILLDDNFEVRLGSLSDVCTQERKGNKSRISRFLRLPQGYKQDNSGTSNANCAYDVHCFGKVLLELVTGKLGVSSAAPNDSTMKDWMEETLPNISLFDKEKVVNIVDPSLIVDEDFLMEVWAVAIVARSCLNPKPLSRPMMKHVLKALENPLKLVTEEDANTDSQSIAAASLAGLPEQLVTRLAQQDQQPMAR